MNSTHSKVGLPDDAGSTELVARLEALGAAARQQDMTDETRAATRLAVSRTLAAPAPVRPRWSWHGPLAKAAALVLLLGGSVGLVSVLHERKADRERLATEARVAALEAKIDRMQQQLEGGVSRWRERYASETTPPALVTAETQRLGSRIGVHRAVLYGELEDARRWAGDSIDDETPHEGGHNEDWPQHESNGKARQAPGPSSVWLHHGDPVLTGIFGAHAAAA